MKKILCFGDSNVDGSELLDHTLPDFPGVSPFYPMDDPRSIKLQKWFNDLMPHRHRIANTPELYEKQKALAFPAALGRALVIETLNHGCGGASQHRIQIICFKEVLAELESGTKPEELLVVVALTSFPRALTFMHKRYLNMGMGRHPTIKGDEKKLDDILVRNWSDDFMHEVHIGYLLGTFAFLDALNIKTVFMDSSFYRAYDDEIQKPDGIPIVKNGWRTLLERFKVTKVRDLPSMNTTIQTRGIKEYRNPGGHFAQEAHDAFGIDLANYIRKTFPDFV